MFMSDLKFVVTWLDLIDDDESRGSAIWYFDEFDADEEINEEDDVDEVRVARVLLDDEEVASRLWTRSSSCPMDFKFIDVLFAFFCSFLVITNGVVSETFAPFIGMIASPFTLKFMVKLYGSFGNIEPLFVWDIFSVVSSSTAVSLSGVLSTSIVDFSFLAKFDAVVKVSFVLSVSSSLNGLIGGNMPLDWLTL